MNHYLFILIVLTSSFAQIYIKSGLNNSNYQTDSPTNFNGEISYNVNIGYKLDLFSYEFGFSNYKISSTTEKLLGSSPGFVEDKFTRSATVEHHYLNTGFYYQIKIVNKLFVNSGVKLLFNMKSVEKFQQKFVVKDLDFNTKRVYENVNSEAELTHMRDLSAIWVIESEFELFQSLSTIVYYEQWLNPIFEDVENFRDNIPTFYMYSVGLNLKYLF